MDAPSPLPPAFSAWFASRGWTVRAHQLALLEEARAGRSTLLVAPTSTSARQASFRPEIEIGGRTTRVLAEQTAAVDPTRLGESVGYLSFDELRRVEAALRLVLSL